MFGIIIATALTLAMHFGVQAGIYPEPTRGVWVSTSSVYCTAYTDHREWGPGAGIYCGANR